MFVYETERNIILFVFELDHVLLRLSVTKSHEFVVMVYVMCCINTVQNSYPIISISTIVIAWVIGYIVFSHSLSYMHLLLMY